jgi:hypothetical protein
MAWRCGSLTTRFSQHGRAIAENAPDASVDFHTAAHDLPAGRAHVVLTHQLRRRILHADPVVETTIQSGGDALVAVLVPSPSVKRLDLVDLVVARDDALFSEEFSYESPVDIQRSGPADVPELLEVVFFGHFELPLPKNI